MSVLLKRLFTVDEYHRMGTTGILPESDRTELIRGEISVQLFPDIQFAVAEILA